MKLRNYLGLVAVLLVCVGCPNDDDDDDLQAIPIRDRGEQAAEDDAEIQEYLQTHFYNYEEFEAANDDFDYKIRFGLIDGENSDRIPLSERMELVPLTYTRFDTEQTLYILTAKQGGSDKPPATFADSVFATIEGVNLNGDTFESIPNPTWLNLPFTLDGFSNGLAGFKGASSGPIANGDGTFSYEDFGVGAVFIPSGLGYFNQSDSGEVYSPLVFTFSIFNVLITDHDGDGIISIDEDLNNNGFLFDAEDNPDEDTVAAFQDPDDDNDGVQTKLETVTDDEGDFVGFLDTDGDGIMDHLDTDDDGDGILTQNEIEISNVTGEIIYTDTDGDGTPDYLDGDS